MFLFNMYYICNIQYKCIFVQKAIFIPLITIKPSSNEYTLVSL